MQQFEYKVIPAPDRGEKVRGAKTPVDRFSQALTAILNRMARDGWDYVRAEMLPSEERSGLTRRTTVYHNVLVFRRALVGGGDDAPAQRQLTVDAPAGKAPRLEAPAKTAQESAVSAAEPLTAAKAAAKDGKPRDDTNVA